MDVAGFRAAPEESQLQRAPDYEPIEDYAVIGDCRSAALISRRGSLDWLCWPRFDSSALFAGLLDSQRGGRFRISPKGTFNSSRRYLPNSNVLITEFTTEMGAARLTDCFFAADEDTKQREFLAPSLLIRQLEVLSGEMEFEVACEPVADFGRKPLLIRQHNSRSFTFAVRDGLVHLALDFDANSALGAITTDLTLRRGESRGLVLSLNEDGPAVFPPLGRINELLETTDGYWRRWASRLAYDGQYADHVARSALALKLLCYAPSGAILAAPTTSLPEAIGAPFNWDYRYCWLRDASYTVGALFGVGLEAEARAFLQWLLHATRLTRPQLQVVYSVFGKPTLVERTLDYLEGYRGSKPVRVGNAAHDQTQLDVYGEVVSAATICMSAGERLSGDERSFLEGIVRYVQKHWRDPDNGIWETRREPRHHVHSKTMCWVALDRGARLARDGLLHLDADELGRAAEEVRLEVQRRGFNEEIGSYTAAFDSSDLDAAALTLPLVGFEDASSPRMIRTIETIRLALGQGELLYRHRNSETAAEGAFLLCSFWLVQCLALQGSVHDARELFERLLGRMNDVGLYAEEADPASDGFLGNFHQAFTHVGLINAALKLREAEDKN